MPKNHQVGVDGGNFETADIRFWKPSPFPCKSDEDYGMVGGGVFRKKTINAGDGTAVGCRTVLNTGPYF